MAGAVGAYDQPDVLGQFGRYGGRFVAETLMGLWKSSITPGESCGRTRRFSRRLIVIWRTSLVALHRSIWLTAGAKSEAEQKST